MSTSTDTQVVDTYKMPAEHAEQSNDKLAKYREQVKEEQAEKSTRHSMSEAALAKLRAIKEQDRIAAVDGARFKHALQSVTVRHENLTKLIDRCYAQGFTDEESGEFQPWGYLNEKGEFVAHGSKVTHLDRRARKLGYWTAAGFRLGQEIETPGQIMFFSELTQAEVNMSDSRFAEEWDAESAASLLKSRIRRGVITEPPVRTVQPVEGVDFRVARNLNGDTIDIEYLTPEDDPAWTGVPKPEAPKKRYCKAGKQCLRYGMDEKRHPGYVVGKGDFCSTNCSQSHKARAKRSKESISEVQEVACDTQNVTAQI